MWLKHLVTYLRFAGTTLPGGLIGHFFHVEEYRSIAGLPPGSNFLPLPDPGHLPHGTTADETERWKAHRTDFHIQERELATAIIAFHNALPPHAMSVAVGPDQLAAIHPRIQLQRLRETYGLLTHSELLDAWAAVQQPYEGTDIRDYLANVQGHWHTLERAGQPVGSWIQHMFLAEALIAEGTNAHTVVHWQDMHPAIQDRTFRSLADAVLTADNRKPSANAATSRTAGFTTPSNPGGGNAYAVTAGNNPVTGKFTPAERATLREADALRRGRKEFWCSTHGANHTHHSPECKRPAVGHQNAATKRNPMGGPVPNTR